MGTHQPQPPEPDERVVGDESGLYMQNSRSRRHVGDEVPILDEKKHKKQDSLTSLFQDKKRELLARDFLLRARPDTPISGICCVD